MGRPLLRISVQWLAIVLACFLVCDTAQAQGKWKLIYPGTNYCGLGSRGGEPTGEVDQACQQHDEAWDRIEADHPGMQAKDRPDLTATSDQVFVQRLTEIQATAATKAERKKAKRVLSIWRAYDKFRSKQQAKMAKAEFQLSMLAAEIASALGDLRAAAARAAALAPNPDAADVFQAALADVSRAVVRVERLVEKMSNAIAKHEREFGDGAFGEYDGIASAAADAIATAIRGLG